MLQDLPSELIIGLTECLDDQRDVYSLVRVSRQTYTRAIDALYSFNAQRCGGSALPWAVARGLDQPAKRAIAAGAPSLGQALCIAVEDKQQGGDYAMARLLLAAEHVDVNFPAKHTGQSPLATVAARGDEPAVKLLLGAPGVDVNSKDNADRSPLLWATLAGHEGVVRMLLDTGRCDMDAGPERSFRPLQQAIMNGHAAVVGLLLGSGKVDVNLRDYMGRTPLSRAAYWGHEDVVQVLLAAEGIRVDEPDDYGITPFSRAAKWGHEGIARLLMDTGQVDVDSEANDGRTPLSYAAEGDHAAIVTLLLSTGKVEVNSRDYKRNSTPLMWVTDRGSDAVVEMLREAGGVDTKLEKPQSLTQRMMSSTLPWHPN